MEGLEVRLDPGPAPRIRPRDRQGDPHGRPGVSGSDWRLEMRARCAKLVGPLGGVRIATNLASMIRDLKRRKARGRRGLALLEGVRLVEEALGAGTRIVGAVVAPELGRTTRGSALRVALESHAVVVQELTGRLFATLADTDAPQGIIAVVEPRHWTPDDVQLDRGAVVLVVDGVQDPGNVGTLVPNTPN